MHKHNADMFVQLYTLAKNGYSSRQIADKLAVSPGTINGIRWIAIKVIEIEDDFEAAKVLSKIVYIGANTKQELLKAREMIKQGINVDLSDVEITTNLDEPKSNFVTPPKMELVVLLNEEEKILNEFKDALSKYIKFAINEELKRRFS